MSESQPDKAEADSPPPYQPPEGSLSVTVPPFHHVGIQSTFHHVYPSISGNYRMFLNDESPSFYIKSRVIREPDLIIHRGTGDHDFEVATCHLNQAGHSHILSILREVNKKSTAMTIRMTGDGQFTATVPVMDTMGTLVGARRTFLWKNNPEKLCLELNDTQTGQMTAAMHGVAYGMAKCFVLQSQASFGPAFDVLVVASAMALYENKRRQSAIGFSPTSRRKRYAGSAATQMALAGTTGGAAMGGGGGC